MFDAVVLPPFDRYRKPEALLFVSTLANACPARAAFIGEDDVEIATAGTLGFSTFHKTADVTMPEGDALTSLFDTFAAAHPEGCDYVAAIAATKKPEDADVQIDACILAP